MPYLLKLAKRPFSNIVRGHALTWLAVASLGACAEASSPAEAEVVALRLAPQDPVVMMGDSLDLAAFGLTAAGDTVALEVTWSAQTGEVRGKGKGKGLYKPRGQGKDKVTASADTLTDSTTVTVVPTARDTTGFVAGLSPAPYQVVQLGVGDQYYIDRAFTLTALDPGLADQLWVRTANDDKANTDEAFLSFELLEAAVVVVGYDRRATALPTWLRDWEPAPVEIAVSDGGASPLTVVAKAYPAGPVVLGGNLAAGAEGAQSMYTVLLLPSAALEPVVLEIAPAGVTLDPGATAQFSATVTDPLGQPVSGATVAWAATGGTITPQGLYTAGGTPGAYEVTATETGSGLNASLGLTIRDTSAAGVASVEVTPATASISVGATVQLTATLTDAAGTVLTGRTVSWSTSNGAVATVNGSGLVSGVAAGSATITATSEGQSGTASVTVQSTDPPPPPPPGGSGTFYVDAAASGASDNNPGTEQAPWKTLNRAAAVLTAGQTVYVKAGRYAVTSANCTWSRPAVNPENSGTATAPIAFRVYPGHRVVLTSDCPAIGTGGADYIIIDGFEVEGSWIAVFNSVGSIVENNVVHGKRCPDGNNCDGIRVNDSDGITIRGNVIYDIWNAERSPNSAGYKSYNTSNSIIEYNEVYETNSGLRNKRRGANNVFRYNWVHDVRGRAIWLQAGIAHKAHHNVTYRCGKGVGISGAGEDRAVNSQAWNNTIVDCGEGIGSGDSGTEVWNNLFYNVNDPSTSGVSFCDYNLYWLTPGGCGSNSLSADPLFVETNFDQESDVELRQGSPAIGAGRNGENIGAK